MYFLEQEAIFSISKKLNLVLTGVEQDWEIEFSNSKRIKEFIFLYKKRNLSDKEKIALMSLIIASYDDFLNEKQLHSNIFENEIEALLKKDNILFFNLLDYWAVNEEVNPENYFMITPFIRSFFSKTYE